MLPVQSLLKIGITTLLISLVLGSSGVTATQPEQSLPHHLPSKTLLAVANQRRVALVIGNSKYQAVNELRNPVNDATDMANTLKNLGFEVISVLNADKKQMDKALEQFQHQLANAGVGLFYYAGHGVQVNGENYLIPIDAKLNSEKDVNYEAIPLGKLQNAMEEAKTDVNVIILDACRNNPFSRKWQRSTAGGGLAPVQAVVGSYIAFGTSPGNTADDGEGRNGRFTGYLLKHIETPNLSIEELFKRVRQSVAQETKNEQIPWDSSSLIGEFFFNQVATTAPSKPSPSPVVIVPPQPVVTPPPTPSPQSNSPSNEISKKPTNKTKKKKNALGSGRVTSRPNSLPSRLSPISPVATSTSTSQLFKPLLIRSVTTSNRRSSSSNYLFTIQIPGKASASLETVTFSQQSNNETITFYPDQFSAFLDKGNSQTEIAIKGELTEDGKIKIIFLQPIPSGNTVTISLKAMNPNYAGVYQFSVTAFPLGNNSQGVLLGVGRIQLYY